MDNLALLRQQKKITTGEAVLTTQAICSRYLKVLTNVLRIKQQLPQDDQQFRINRGNTALLKDLQSLLEQLDNDAKVIEQELIQENL